MRKALPLLLLLGIIVAGCNLAGDITPPSGVATAQAIRPTQGSTTTVPQPSSAPVVLTPPKTPANIQRGEAIYLESCEPCHGVDGMGDGSQAVNLPEGISPSHLGDPDLAFKTTPAQWFSAVSIGNIERSMPGFSSMSDAQRWDVVAYALSLSVGIDTLTNGEGVYLESCAECHGAMGEGTEIGSPLADPSFISDRSIQDLIRIIAEGMGEGMPGFADELSDEQLQNASTYVMSLALTGEMVSEPEEIVTEPEGTLTGYVLGQVTNGSSGNEIPAGTEITLYGFEGQQEVVLETTTVESDGPFSFGEIEMQPGWVFVAVLAHQGVTYGSEIFEFDGEQEVFLPVTIFDTSTDLDFVRVERLHLIFNVPMDGILEVTELWILSNFGEFTIANSDGSGVLEIDLPAGATNLRFESGALGERYLPTEDGFADTLPLRPGLSVHELVFSFELPYDKRLKYVQEMKYPVDAIVMLAPASGPELEGEGLLDMGARDMSGTQLRSYEVESIEAGTALEVLIKGSPGSVDQANVSSLTPVVIGIGSLILAAVFVGAWWFRIRTPDMEQTPDKPYTAEIDEGIQEQDSDALLRAIANLDNAFEGGAMDEQPYQERRAELKAQLLNLMQDTDHD